MRQKIKTIAVILAIIVIIFVVGIFFGVNTGVTDEVPTKINTVITFTVSIVALGFAMITYFSIDSVDKKNRMENNILQAEKYRPTYRTIMDKLNVKNEEDFSEALYNAMKKPKIYTCMQYADWLQTIVDYLIFGAYVQTDESKINDLIKDLEKQKAKFQGVGSEIDTLFQENVKLIEHVLTYQSNRKQKKYEYSALEDVQGDMLGNPISRIVYYDYLGLDYKGLVTGKMLCKFRAKEFSDEYFEYWEKKSISDDEKEKCLFFIDRALKCFYRAKEEASNDIIWEGYLDYNIVRVSILQFLFMDKKQRKRRYSEILKDIDECIIARQHICFMFSSEGYLKEQFDQEVFRAKRLKKSFVKAFGKLDE